MKLLMSIVLGLSLAFAGASISYAGDPKYKEKTKVKVERDGDYKEKTKIKDDGGKSKEKTKIEEHSGKVKVKHKRRH